MTLFRVWAPRARKVQLDLHSTLVDMTAEPNGWHSVEVDTKGLEIEYAFRLDEHGPTPDPRSPYQPRGVTGPSRTVDHSRFQWTDQGFSGKPLSSGIIYELHIGTFTSEGTFESAIERLDHLVELGITHIELMPVIEFPGKRGWGYDGVDLFAPHHHYGGPNGLKALVNACHERGLAVILDVVYNHVGPTGNYFEHFAPYFMEEHPGRWGQPFNFGEAHSDEVRQFFLDNMRMWFVDYHLDGLRLDAVHVMIDYSAFHFLEEVCAEADEIEAHVARSLVMIAESDANDPQMVRSRDAHGMGFDAQWIDDFHHALHAYLTGQTEGYFAGFGTLKALAHTLTEGFYYCGTFCPHRERSHGRSSDGISAHRFIGFLQNHDQVGNRYAGERSVHFLSRGQAKIAAAIVLLGPYIPMLFMGEEWGASTPFLYFTDHEDPELARAVSIGRQKDFEKIGWDPDQVPDPQDPQTLEKSKLKWEEIGQTLHQEMLDWHRLMIQLRKRFPDLTNGKLDRVEVNYDEAAQWMLINRGEVLIAVNFAKEQRQLPLQNASRLDRIAASDNSIEQQENAAIMPPESVAVFGPQEQ